LAKRNHRNKGMNMKFFKILLLIVLLVSTGAFISYSISKKTSEELVSSSEKYFSLSKTNIILRSNDIIPLWRFVFSHPDIFDAEFEIYTSMFGKLVKTNPTNLIEEFERLNKLDVHPLSPEGRAQLLKEIVEEKEEEEKKIN